MYMFKCFGRKEQKNNPYEQYELWKEDLFSNAGGGECLISTTFENELFYAEASMFFDKNPGEPIGIKKYNKSKITYCINKEKTTEECPICFDKLQKTFSKKYITLECGHSFHEKCFIQHADTQKKQILAITCPMCRFGVSKDDEEILRLKGIRQSRRYEYDDYDSSSNYSDDY